MTAAEALREGRTDGAPLVDKAAIVTGGASGLGRAMALEPAEGGARVVVADLDARTGREVADLVGGVFRACDVSDLEANRTLVDFAQDQYGGVDIALLAVSTPRCSTRAWRPDAASVTTSTRRATAGRWAPTSTAWSTAPRGAAGAAGPRRRGDRGDRLPRGTGGGTARPSVAADKHAVVGLARSLGPALAPDKVRFNAVCPGFAESRIIGPLRDMLSEPGLPVIPAEVVADTVLRIVTGGGAGECWFVQGAANQKRSASAASPAQGSMPQSAADGLGSAGCSAADASAHGTAPQKVSQPGALLATRCRAPAWTGRRSGSSAAFRLTSRSATVHRRVANTLSGLAPADRDRCSVPQHGDRAQRRVDPGLLERGERKRC
ncbi:SDR family NAD(P)-dependent oxidoreductase [Streptomyces sp. NA02950]|uniref:SDR family NAD(P)-dependent oxidoreductase n=1 Tax=Streptomyces sp. NA02950 TaxID=2742137 RepID=UPI001C376E5A|nr:SDR family NAD(P)-dependent oxidoreductase [Streptomyces sp. NA02950]